MKERIARSIMASGGASICRSAIFGLALASAAFADYVTKDLVFDLSALPAQATVTSAALSFTFTGLVSPGPFTDLNPSQCGFYQPNYCGVNPVTADYGFYESWLANDGPYVDVNEFMGDVRGPGFPPGGAGTPPPGSQFGSPAAIDPVAIHPGGTYVAFVDTLARGAYLYCDDYWFCGYYMGPADGRTQFTVTGNASGTLDVAYLLGGDSYSRDFAAQTSWSYVTPEPASYRLAILFAAIGIVVLRFARASGPPYSTPKA